MYKWQIKNLLPPLSIAISLSQSLWQVYSNRSISSSPSKFLSISSQGKPN